MVLPSGDQTGWRASLNTSVMRLAAPPVAGSTQMLPCRSMASILPSGETDTDMEVPSSTVTDTVFKGSSRGDGALLAPPAGHSGAASGVRLLFKKPSGFEPVSNKPAPTAGFKTRPPARRNQHILFS